MCIKGWWVGDHRGQVWDGGGEAFLATLKDKFFQVCVKGMHVY